MDRPPFQILLKVWHAVPLKLVLLLVLLSLFLKNPREGVRYRDERAEYYPFSNYPMYSQFDEEEYYVYLADQHGEPLPSKETFRITTPKVKKRFKMRLGEMARARDKKKSEVDGADLEAVAVATLETLENAVMDHPRVAALEELQMIYVELRRVDGRIESTERVIGSIPMGEGSR